jgi:transaldolase
MNLLQTLCQHGQSVWVDGLERHLILTGQLQRSIDNGLRGVLSNFTSLEQAIRAGSYDRDFQVLDRHPKIDAQSVYAYLTIQDMQLAADLMKVVHTQTHAGDGFVNLDLPPQFAVDPETMLTEARRLWQTVGWSNLMLKLPATAATLSVIQPLIYEGININVTMLSSPEIYEQVAEAYVQGLEALSIQGKAVSTVASVASVSISRLDDAIAALMDRYLKTAKAKGLPESFADNVAIAQAKVMYQRYQTLYQSDRWQALARLGAQPQRLLWDIISVENDLAHAQRYIESLMGADTVLAMSPLMLKQQKPENPLQSGLTVGVEAAHHMLETLEQMVPLEAIADQLLTEELQRSQAAYEQLLKTIEQKR